MTNIPVWPFRQSQTMKWAFPQTVLHLYAQNCWHPSSSLCVIMIPDSQMPMKTSVIEILTFSHRWPTLTFSSTSQTGEWRTLCQSDVMKHYCRSLHAFAREQKTLGGLLHQAKTVRVCWQCIHVFTLYVVPHLKVVVKTYRMGESKKEGMYLKKRTTYTTVSNHIYKHRINKTHLWCTE